MTSLALVDGPCDSCDELVPCVGMKRQRPVGPPGVVPYCARCIEGALTAIAPHRDPKLLAAALSRYAVMERDCHKTMAFFGNDARSALAQFLSKPVEDLEPGKVERSEYHCWIFGP